MANNNSNPFSPLVDKLISALRCLPSVGPKSAQRMAFHLLARDRTSAKNLAACLTQAVTEIGHCQQCNTFAETAICQLCANPRRDANLLCIVESPADILAIEDSGAYQGHYFVLMGRLSPLDGIGPDEIGIDQLTQQLANKNFQEIILATNSTVEGEATAHYIAELIKQYQIKITRLAHGIPLGGELEFVDGGTLARALTAREEFLAV